MPSRKVPTVIAMPLMNELVKADALKPPLDASRFLRALRALP